MKNNLQPSLISFFFLIFLVSASIFNSLHAQTLSGTTWRVNDTDQSLIGYFHFGVDDTLTFSFDNFSFSNLSTYVENGSDFTVTDFSGGPCGSGSIPGNYSFQIQNNNLVLSLKEPYSREINVCLPVNKLRCTSNCS